MAFTLYIYYRRLTGDQSSPIFWTAQIVRETLPFWIILIYVIGWIVLTRHFVCRPLRYLDEIVAAAEQLVSPSDRTITLSSSLKDIQNNLNLVRAQALRNAILAKEAEQRKNDLVVYLAHDLKTPLTSVIGYLTLLRDEPYLSPEFRERYTGIALDKAMRLEDLINEFFDITRFNLTTLTLDKEQVHLSRMLEQITNEFLPILTEKDLSWRTEIAPNVELLCDPAKMERVFDNLIRNAVNYSYPGTEILLSMRTSGSPSADSSAVTSFRSAAMNNAAGTAAPGGDTAARCVLITVSNHGRTIPPDKLNRIFEQFFRLDSSRATATGGAGLGLAISKEIVELHGGTISAASENETITFTVKFPMD
ncbi:MAG: HAMP domain-containing histidine kinase [Acetatifactor sp.]|nr:HAMP domain-containing histidine kinase [Acetatifactor sp.]